MSSPGDVDDRGRAPSRTEASAGSARTAPFDATVSDRWWWWIAAVPLYAVVVFAAMTVVGLGVGLGVLFTGAPLPHAFGGGGMMIVAAAMVLLVLPSFVLAVAFPLALYVDARAVNDADVSWNPDAVLYALVGLVGAVLTSFVLTVPVALYYLYRRHEAIGIP